MLAYSTQESDYIFFLKSGHTLLKTVFRNVFLRHSIDFSSYQTIEPESKEFRKKQKFLFVRNPIDRFFSSYYYFNFDKLLGLDNYIKQYSTICEQGDDPHIKPQYNCLTFVKSAACLGMYNYFYNELGKCELVRIEDIDKDIEDFMGNKSESRDLYNEESTFNFLNSENKVMSIDFTLLYCYFKTYYEKKKLHHKKIDFLSKIDRHQYGRVYDLLKDEMLFYGYEKHDLAKCKKSIL